MTTASYNAANLFAVRLATPLAGNPAWANLKIDSNKRLYRNVASGAGLYAIHYRGHLLYIGKFLGTRTNPFASNVCFTRWAKHLGTLTLRDRRVSFSRKAIDDLRLRQPLVPPLSDIVAAAAHPVITKPRGRVSSLNRALFAAENWGRFRNWATRRDSPTSRSLIPASKQELLATRSRFGLPSVLRKNRSFRVLDRVATRKFPAERGAQLASRIWASFSSRRS